MPLSASALITALFAAVIAGGKASPFVFGGLSAIFALSLFYWRARFPWTKYCSDRVLIAFVVFCTYVGISAFWSEAPSKALIAAIYLGACAGVAVWLVRAVPLVNAIAQELFARDFLRGYAAGLCFLIFEVLTNQSINKFVANAFRGLFSHDGKFYVDVEGTIGHVEPGILNWSIVAVNLLAWPALLYTAVISIPEHRLRNQISLYCAVCSLVFLSVHATSKIALISGLITFILAPLGCSGTAEALARTLFIGEGRSAFTAWGRAEFGVYLCKRHLIFVRANCTPEDVHDDFAIHFLFRDPSAPDKPQTGSDWRRFRFSDFGYLTNGYCSALYPIAAVNVHHITTGQVIEGKGFTWRVDLDWAPSADNQ